MGTGTYVKLPDMWRQVLLERGASAADYAVALELLAMARFATTVKLSNIRTRQMGISRATRWRTLERLARTLARQRGDRYVVRDHARRESADGSTHCGIGGAARSWLRPTRAELHGLAKRALQHL